MKQTDKQLLKKVGLEGKVTLYGIESHIDDDTWHIRDDLYNEQEIELCKKNLKYSQKQLPEYKFRIVKLRREEDVLTALRKLSENSFSREVVMGLKADRQEAINKQIKLMDENEESETTIQEGEKMIEDRDIIITNLQQQLKQVQEKSKEQINDLLFKLEECDAVWMQIIDGISDDSKITINQRILERQQANQKIKPCGGK